MQCRIMAGHSVPLIAAMFTPFLFQVATIELGLQGFQLEYRNVISPSQSNEAVSSRNRRSVTSSIDSSTPDGGARCQEVESGLKEIGSARFQSFRLKVFKHSASNRGLDLPNNRYFYAPISLLDVNDTRCTSSHADPNSYEVVLSVVMWSDQSQEQVTLYLNELLCKGSNASSGCPITRHNVEVISSEQVRLLGTMRGKRARLSAGCWVDSAWIPYQAQQLVNFVVSCQDRGQCDALATSMKQDPERYRNHLQVNMPLTSAGHSGTRTRRIWVTNFLGSKLAARIDQQMRKRGHEVKTVWLMPGVYRALLQEAATSVVTDTFDGTADFVDDSTHNGVMRIVEKFVSSSETLITDAKMGETTWESVFWAEEKFRPDKVAAAMNEVHKELDANDRKSLQDAYSAGNTRAGLGLSGEADGGSARAFSSGGALHAAMKIAKAYSISKDEATAALARSREYVQWRGKRFVHKELQLVGINFANLRDVKSLNDQSVQVRDAPAVLSTPVHLLEPNMAIPPARRQPAAMEDNLAYTRLSAWLINAYARVAGVGMRTDVRTDADLGSPYEQIGGNGDNETIVTRHSCSLYCAKDTFKCRAFSFFSDPADPTRNVCKLGSGLLESSSSPEGWTTYSKEPVSAGDLPGRRRGFRLGCFKDKEPRLLPIFTKEEKNPYNVRVVDVANGFDPSMTRTKCISNCAFLGHVYAGLQARGYCMCGTTFQFRLEKSHQCNEQCSGDNSRTCGGSWASDVFETGIVG